jgi:hypothetical protein
MQGCISNAQFLLEFPGSTALGLEGFYDPKASLKNGVMHGVVKLSRNNTIRTESIISGLRLGQGIICEHLNTFYSIFRSIHG